MTTTSTTPITTSDQTAAGALGLGNGTMGGAAASGNTHVAIGSVGNTGNTGNNAAGTGGTITTGTSTSAANAWKAATYPTIMSNGKHMVDAKGKPLPDNVDGPTFMAALFLKDNQKMADDIRTKAVAGNYYAGAGFTNYTYKPGSKFTQDDATVLQTAMMGATSSTSGLTPGAPVDLLGYMSQQDSIASSPYFAGSTYSRISKDQPNVVASNKVVNDLFLNFMGRSATQNELAAYSNAYLKYAAANPTMVESGSTSYVPATNPLTGSLSRIKSNQNYTSTSNNLNESDFVENQVRQSGDYNAYTAAGTAFNLMQKLAASNRAGV
jgi:hypothetical protein